MVAFTNYSIVKRATGYNVLVDLHRHADGLYLPTLQQLCHGRFVWHDFFLSIQDDTHGVTNSRFKRAPFRSSEYRLRWVAWANLFARAHPIADTGKLSLAHATHQIT